MASLGVSCQDHRGQKSSVFDEVVSHYQASAKDSLKVLAARYLAEYIDGQYSYVGAGLDAYEKFSTDMEKIHRAGLIHEFNRDSIIRSGISRIEENRGSALLLAQYDRDLLTRDFLIDNIDNAFNAWRMFPWSREVSFDDFCEYILPYKVFQEPLTIGWRAKLQSEYHWVIDSLRDSTDLVEVTLKLNKSIREKLEYSAAMNALPTVFGPQNLRRIGYGNCLQLVTYTTYVLRAMGIPAMIDFTPTWGNNSSGHTWGAIKVGRTLFTYDAIYTDTKVESLQKTNVIPEAVLRNRRSPKIYRYSYKKNPLKLGMAGGNIPTEFTNEYILDVTKQYAHPVTSYDIQIDTSLNNYPLFLSVYNRNDWKLAVQGQKIGQRKYRFGDIGTGIVYLPVAIKNSKVVPIAAPFLLEADGAKVFAIEKDAKREITLYRKSNVDYDLTTALNNTVGGIFEGSNSPSFSDSQELYRIRESPKAGTNIYHVGNKGYFRFVRFTQPDVQCRLAEFTVYGMYDRSTTQRHIKWERVNGNFITSGHVGVNSPANITDGNVLTYYVSKAKKNGYVGFDVGDSLKVRVTTIEFYPPNDGNAVEIGDLYQLCYWDNEWIIVGEKVARDEHLVFKDCPNNAIFRLRNLTKGYKERIFSYSNGQQVWW